MNSASGYHDRTIDESEKFVFREYFERIYVINLPERVDRLKQITLHLDQVGMPIDGDKVRLFQGVKPRDKGGFPSIGARGCFLTHLSVVREARSTGLANVLIIEDDLQLAPLFLRKKSELVSRLRRTDWNFVYLGHCLPMGSKENWTLQEYDGPIVGTHFQAISGDTLDPLCDFLEETLTRPSGDPRGGPMSYDGAQHMFRNLQTEIVTLISSPSLGCQRPSRSDVTPKWFDTLPLIRVATSWTRKTLQRLQKDEHRATFSP